MLPMSYTMTSDLSFCVGKDDSYQTVTDSQQLISSYRSLRLTTTIYRGIYQDYMSIPTLGRQLYLSSLSSSSLIFYYPLLFLTPCNVRLRVVMGTHTQGKSRVFVHRKRVCSLLTYIDSIWRNKELPCQCLGISYVVTSSDPTIEYVLEKTELSRH